MNRFLLIALCSIISVGAFAQKGEKAIGLNLSYGTEIKNIGIGAKGQYNFTNAIRGEASFDYFLKKDGLSMWDLNLNAHYLFQLGDKLKVYPLAGLSFTNWKFDFGDTDGDLMDGENSGSMSTSKFGANLGGGIQYDITSILVLNAEAKYQLINDFDQAVFNIGIAYKF